MARRRYICDFETTTDENDCRVWLWGSVDVDNDSVLKYDNSMESFIAWCESTCEIGYFHNLRFDGEFIINWLLHNGYKYSDSGRAKTFTGLVSDMGQWYSLDICFGYTETKKRKKKHMVLYDSLKKLPFPVKVIAKAFGLDVMKGEIDYHAFRDTDHQADDEELAYLKNDVQIVARALKTQLDQGLKKMTNGSDAFGDFVATISTSQFNNYFPVLSLEIDSLLRKAYRGGFTWLNPVYEDKDVGEGIVFDVNSLYPSQMMYRELPVGMPVLFEGRYVEDERYPLWIQEINVMFEVKKDHIPTIQIKGSRWFQGNEYLDSSEGLMVKLFVTNIDMELIEKHYDLLAIEYVQGWKFQKRKGIFDTYINKWMYVKMTETGAKKTLAKLMLNSLYGKFATNPDITGKIPYLKPDGSTGWRKANGEWEKDEKTGEIKWVLKEHLKEYRDPVYTAMGIFITSWARYTTISAAQLCFPERLIYCDTDSIHLTGTEIPDVIKDIVDPNKLGYWKHESTFERARFIRQKTYVEQIDGKLDVKCAGMPDACKKNVTWDNFHVGFTSTGKLLPKRVKGGVVLVDTEFTIN